MWISRIGLGLLVGTAALSYREAHRFMRADSWRKHSSEVLSRISAVELSIKSAEGALRGYLLGKRPELYDELRTSEKAAEEQLASLEPFIADNPPQSALLAGLRDHLRQREQFWDEIISTELSGHPEEARALVLGARAPALRKALATSINEFTEREKELRGERTRTTQRDFERSVWVVTASLALSFALLLFVMRNLRAEIARRRDAERALSESKDKAEEASQIKSRFLANMSHEIRTPLNGIIGMTRMLERIKLNAKQTELLGTIKVSSTSLLALINQVLDLSKIESGKLQLEEAPFELKSLVTSTLSIVEYGARSKSLDLKLDWEFDASEFVLGDALRLRQVVLNLLNNAIKFSDRGTVRLTVTRKPASDSRVNYHFEVSDEGIGLDEDARTKLFQAFTQGDSSTSRKYGGTGLGLVISRQIVELMGGKIDFKSELGKGSRFYFDVTLRAAKFSVARFEGSQVEQSHGALNGKVLVAEDNRMNQLVMQEMLTNLGCTFESVDNGAAALVALKQKRFDLVLMDGQMPEMDGFETSQRIRRGEAGTENLTIPIVATTANAIKGDIEKCMAAGMNDYVSKPIAYEDLAFKLEKWIQRGRELIDLTAVKKIDDLGRRGNVDLRSELLVIFREERETMLPSLRELCSQGDYVGVSKIAHSLKSAAANLGAMRLRDVAERLEKAKTDPVAEHIGWLIDALQTEYDMALNALGALTPVTLTRAG